MFPELFFFQGGPGWPLVCSLAAPGPAGSPGFAPAGPALSGIGFQLGRRRGSALSPSLRPVCFSICVGKEGCWAFKDPAHLSGLRGWQGPGRSGEPVLDQDGVRPPGPVHPTGRGRGSSSRAGKEPGLRCGFRLCGRVSWLGAEPALPSPGPVFHSGACFNVN